MSDSKFAKSGSSSHASVASVKESHTNAIDHKAILERYRKGTGSNYQQQIFPDITKYMDPSFHYCWLSESNSVDSIESRIADGYVPCLWDEFPHLTEWAARQKQAGRDGNLVRCREMILHKVPKEIAEAMANYFHIDEPNRISAEIRRTLEDMADGKGRKLVKQEGSDAFKKAEGKVTSL